MKQKKDIWIFLSHSSNDFDKVRRIRNYLEDKSYRPLMFYLKCLDSEEEIYDLITREIDVRTRFILCDSENARGSNWVKKEMDYISNQNPPRSFLRIDLSQSDEVIHQQLDKYVNQMNIFISYSSLQFNLFDKIRLRLSKYDLNVMPNHEQLGPEQILAVSGLGLDNITGQIEHAANNGYVVILYSERAMHSKWVTTELKLADHLGANILFFALDRESLDKCSSDCSLAKYQHIDVSGFSDKDKADAITNLILENILPIGGLITFAENFRLGRLGIIDIEESQKLYNFLFDKAEKSGNPHALKFIGECYEYGRGGKPIDLHKASEYYSLAIHEPGGPQDEAFLNHVRELNNQLFSESHPSSNKVINWIKHTLTKHNK